MACAVARRRITLVNGSATLFPVWMLWGAFWALSSGASSAYCYELIVREGMEEEAVSVFGTMRAVANVAMLTSHLAAGFLFTVDPALPFVANGAMALVALAIASTLPDIERSSQETPEGVKEVAAG